MAVEDVEGGTRRTTSWFKAHVVEIIGAIIALILLVFAWKARSSGSTTVAPATTGTANQNTPQPTDTSQFATLSDLTNAIAGVTQQEQADVAALTAQIGQTQDNLTSGLSSLQSTLQSAEQADVGSLTAQLQAQAKQLTDTQNSLQSQIQAAQQAGQAALAAGLQQQSTALSNLQTTMGQQIAGLQAGTTSNSQAVANINTGLNYIANDAWFYNPSTGKFQIGTALGNTQGTSGRIS